MLVICNALSVTQDQKPKDDAGIRGKKTGKWLNDQVSELQLKKKNRKVTCQE